MLKPFYGVSSDCLEELRFFSVEKVTRTQPASDGGSLEKLFVAFFMGQLQVV